jgi:predicted Zn-ribbon and HTH transcriptional regulator
MARYQCRACGFDDHAPWDGNLECPRCRSSTEVRVAMATEEFTEEEVAAVAADI